MEQWTGYCELTTDAPVVYHAASALTLLSMVLPSHVVATVGGVVIAPVWTMLVGAPGASRKTTAARRVMRLLEAAEPSLVGLPSHESVAILMEDLSVNPRRLFIHLDYGDFLSRSGKNTYLTGIRERMLLLYDGDDQEKESKGGGLVTVRQPRISQLACVTPGELEDHTSESDYSSGGMSRWTYFFARQTRHLPMPPTYDNLKAGLVEQVIRIFERPVGTFLGLEPDAEALFVDWASQLWQVAQTSQTAWTEAVYARAQAAAMKFAFAYSVDVGNAGRSRGRPWKMDAYSLYHGILMCNLHLQSIAEILTVVAMSPFMRERRSVLDAVGRGTLREFSDIVRRTMPKMHSKKVRSILESLVDERRIFKTSVPGMPGEFYTDSTTATITPDASLAKEAAVAEEEAHRAEAARAEARTAGFEQRPSGVFVPVGWGDATDATETAPAGAAPAGATAGPAQQPQRAPVDDRPPPAAVGMGHETLWESRSGGPQW